MSDTAHEALRALEAVIFAAEAPLGLGELTRHVGERGDLPELLRQLADSYAPRGIILVERGGRWAFQTAPDLAHHLRPTREAVRKLSRAAVETLSVIAYHEPVTRPEIEEIRGVAVSPGTLDVLMEAGWVRPAGRRESPGRPLQYATTPGFLAHFNLASRRDLPGLADLKAAGLLDREPPRELPLPLGGREE
ncbi:segregation and condensation protein B [Polymorphobacter multimanifer]|uniref:Segregation and condensation protein B n=1 Tax=Polymorphobacter multimanifer TaxID=1070431 RepID=A0A841L740_9SPHN|nr:SMC-Scp complex subunit ScpB [Polymorphobacter multimanifer]MBB6227391.1 segregation and condensation protein B [Polymorphobacter multimanifer]